MVVRANESGILKGIASLAIGIVLFVLHVSITNADSRRAEQFGYDSAGNLTQSISITTSNPPVVTGLAPGYINIGRAVSMQVTGTDLFGAEIAISDPAITVANINHTATQIFFTLTASDEAVLGAATLTFSTSLGSTTETVIVEARAPGITTVPNPISLAPDSITKTIELIFDLPADIQQTYDVAIADSTIASLGQATITLLVGEASTTVDLTGLVLGNTELTISSSVAPRFTLSLPVIVTEPFSGDTIGVSNQVGIIVGTEDPAGTPVVNSIPSSIVGVIIGTEDPTGTPITNSMASSIVGLIVGTEDPSGAAESALFGSPLTGTLVGAVIQNMNPVTAALGSEVSLSFSGYNLRDVTGLTITPADDITFGAIAVDPSGTVLTIPVIVGAAAITGTRQVIVMTPLGPVPVIDSFQLELTIQ